MLEDVYQKFNTAHYTPEKYAALLKEITDIAGDPCVRMAEAPVFIDQAYADQLVKGAEEIMEQALKLDLYVPQLFKKPKSEPRPSFCIVDFAISKDGPRLIELQAFPSNILFAPFSGEMYKKHYGLEGKYLFCTEEQLRKTIMGDHAAENVILMEINPWQQPSRRDFILTQKKFGIPIVDINDVIRKDKQLFYTNAEGKETLIKRIYSRVVPGEYQSLGLYDKAAFRFNEELDVEWASDPEWFLRVSKNTLPHLRHPMVPYSWPLDQMSVYPMDLENYVLKPTYLNAGIGVKLNINEAQLNAVHASKRNQYILMEKIHFEPFIPAPDGNKFCAEIRVMFIWPDKNSGKPVHTGFSARVMKGNDTNANLWGKDPWCGIAPVLVV